jgi:hypothetical protein
MLSKCFTGFTKYVFGFFLCLGFGRTNCFAVKIVVAETITGLVECPSPKCIIPSELDNRLALTITGAIG